MPPPADPLIVKCYTERGVQTAFTADRSTELWLTRSVSNSTNGSRILPNHGSESQSSSRAPTPLISYPQITLQSPCSLSVPDTHTGNFTRDSKSNRQKPPYSRPPGTMKLKIRAVSLPETSGQQKLADIFQDQRESRVVSLPECITLSLSAENSIDSSQSQEKSFREELTFFSTKPHYSGIRFRPSCAQPHTPSKFLPSSTDSFLFTNDRQQLPEIFQDNDPRLDRGVISDEDGWITWAHSPPRPIPALHGPLSLPYARCPSGAEGTIIEGQDDLPRMIWGMDINNPPPYNSHDLHSSSKVREIPSHHESVKPSVKNEAKKQMYLVTPRLTPTLLSTHVGKFHTISRENERFNAEMFHPPKAGTVEQRYSDTTQKNAKTPNDLLRHGTAKASGTWDGFYGNTQTLSQPEHRVDIFSVTPLNWQTLRTQEVSVPCLSSTYHRTELGHLLKPSAPAFVPIADQPSMIAYPQIFVEPRSPQLSRDASLPSRVSSDRVSPITCSKSIPFMGLPTPPSSTSPQWSSKFSPYQSPSQAPDITLSQHTQYTKQPRAPIDPSNALRKLVHERVSGRTAENLQSSPAAPFTQPLQSPTSKAQKFKYMQNLRVPSILSVDSSRHPGPPPSFPLPPLPSTAPHTCSQSNLFGPRSTSTPPRSRTRSISYQHPRSVPLARLLQRRLASVPEEELSYHTGPPSPLSSQWQLNTSSGRLRGQTVLSQQPYRPVVPAPNIKSSPGLDLHRSAASESRDDKIDTRDKRIPPLHIAPAKVDLPSNSTDPQSKRSTEAKARPTRKRRERARKDKPAVDR